MVKTWKKTWKRRWFVLKDGELLYFKSPVGFIQCDVYYFYYYGTCFGLFPIFTGSWGCEHISSYTIFVSVWEHKKYFRLDLHFFVSTLIKIKHDLICFQPPISTYCEYCVHQRKCKSVRRSYNVQDDTVMCLLRALLQLTLCAWRIYNCATCYRGFTLLVVQIN